MFSPFNKFLEIIAGDPSLGRWLTRLPQDLENFLKSAEGQEFRRYEKILERTRPLHAESLNLKQP